MSTSKLLAAGLLALPLAVVVPATAAQAAACARVKSDFNGDGRADVAAGAPQNPDGDGLGSVSIVYDPVGAGSAAVKQTIAGSSLPVHAWLGVSLASGYFDPDCYADLVVGVGSEPGIIVLRGSATGLTTEGAKSFQRSAIPGGEHHAWLGETVAAGDFNGDGLDDIAAGAPDKSEDEWPGTTDGGAVAIFPGSADGATATGAKWIMEGADGMAGVASEFEVFGAALAAGDFTGDGFTDLAVGAPGEERNSGAVVVARGGPAGLTGTGSVLLDQSSPGVPGTRERGDRFGNSLAAGDFTGDGRADLVVGSPREALGDLTDAGSIAVLPGSDAGPTGTGSFPFTQDTAGVPGTGEQGDRFGGSLSVADFNGDTRPDIAVSSYSEDVSTATDTGSVTILYGTLTGPSATGSRYIDQNSPGIPGANESGDHFGADLTAVPGALAVGAPDEQTSAGSSDYVGAFSVLTGNLSAGTFFGPAQFPGAIPDGRLGLALG